MLNVEANRLRSLGEGTNPVVMAVFDEVHWPPTVIGLFEKSFTEQLPASTLEITRTYIDSPEVDTEHQKVELVCTTEYRGMTLCAVVTENHPLKGIGQLLQHDFTDEMRGFLFQVLLHVENPSDEDLKKDDLFADLTDEEFKDKLYPALLTWQ